MRKRLWGLCVLLVLSSPASAAVVYNWQTVSAAGYSTTFTGRIEIDDAAWRSGRLTHINAPVCPPASCSGEVNISDPSNPVLRFAFGGQPHYFGGYAIDLHYRTGQGAVFDSIGEFDLTMSALLAGDIYADSGETTVIMGGGPVWTISYFDSDAGWFCGGPEDRCAGVTGLWVLDLSTIPVPEPATATLAALGLAAALAGRRRKGAPKATRIG